MILKKIVMKKKLIYLFIFIITPLCLGIFVITPAVLDKNDGIAWHIKQIVPEPIKLFIKKKFFTSKPLKRDYKYAISALDKKEENFYILNVSKELEQTSNKVISSQNGTNYLSKKISLPFDASKAWKGKPTGYLEYYNDNLIIASAKGEFISIKKKFLSLKKIPIKVIPSNFSDLAKEKKIYIGGNPGIRDLLIVDDYLFVSYPKKIGNGGCLNISIMYAKMNLEFLKFSEFFSHNKCMGSFETTRSGGRLSHNNDEIFFTIGDYGIFGDSNNKPAPQDINNYFGKNLSINIRSKKVKVLSIGHRNQQGLFYNKENNLLLSTEHGPDGGDELNILDLTSQKVENFGWPISSDGKHYLNTKKREDFKEILKSAPLHKSHKQYGFKEPILNWTPSIGIQQIVKVDKNFDNSFKNDFFIGALGNNIPEGDMTIHHYRFDQKFQNTLYQDKIVVGERIRDLLYVKDLSAVFLILENSASLNILTKNKNY